MSFNVPLCVCCRRTRLLLLSSYGRETRAGGWVGETTPNLRTRRQLQGGGCYFLRACFSLTSTAAADNQNKIAEYTIPTAFAPTPKANLTVGLKLFEPILTLSAEHLIVFGEKIKAVTLIRRVRIIIESPDTEIINAN
jgi:hypothetical protein